MKITKKKLNYSCYCCNKSIRGKTKKRETCPDCNAKGRFKDEIYYHFFGNQCIIGDTLK